MWNKNKKRIVELEKEVEDLQIIVKELLSVKIEKDAITKNLHYVEDMVCINGCVESNIRLY